MVEKEEGRDGQEEKRGERGRGGSCLKTHLNAIVT